MNILNKIGKELVLALLNRDNGVNPSYKALTFNDVTFSPPTPLPVTPDFRNTKITVYANPNSGYRGERVVAYWRLELSKLLVGANRNIMAEGVTDTLELLDRINQRFDMAMTADDVIVEPIDTTTMPRTYVLKTHPSSFAYIGQVELTLVNALIDLGEAIPIDVLAGLDYPFDPELTQGNLTFLDDNNHLLSAPGVIDMGMVKTTNLELELYAGIHIQDPNMIIEPVGGIYDLDLGITDQWYLDVGMGLLPAARARDMLDMYRIDMSISYTDGGTVMLNLVQDSNGDFGWSFDNSLPSADLIYSFEREVMADTLDLAWFKDILAHLPVNDVGSITGSYNVVLRAIPLSTIVVKPLEIALRININPI